MEESASTELEKIGEPDSVEPRMLRAGLTGFGPDCLCDPHCDLGLHGAWVALETLILGFCRRTCQR